MPTPLAPLLLQLRRAARLPGTDGTSDAQLLGSFLAARDEAAFEALVVRHGPMVLGVCQRVLRDPHEAEDAFQATFLVLARKASSVVPPEMVGCWLYGVAYRTALKARALAARRRAKERQVKDVPRPEPLDQEARNDLRARLDRELERLPAKYRAAVVLCDLEGKSRCEAAAQLGVAEGTLSSRLCRGRRLLANRLGGRGRAVSAAALAEACSPAVVPAPLVLSTVKAAALVAAGQAAAAVATAKVAALTEGVLQSMSLSKLKCVLSLVLVVVLGAGTLGSPALSLMMAREEPEAPFNWEDDQKVEKQEKPKPGQKEKKKNPDRRAKAEETVTKTFSTKKAPRLVVETFNGHVEVKTGAAGAAKAKVLKTVHAATKEAAEEGLKTVEVQLAQEGDTIRVTAKSKGEKGEQSQINRAAAVEVEIPPGATLDLHTSNGHVTVTGDTADVSVISSNGRVDVKGSKGALKLKTTNGRIKVEGGSGKLDLNTGNGKIDVKATKAKVTAHTSNGSIHFTGGLADGEHSFGTSNGSLSLTLPADSRFRLEAETSNGKVNCRFPHKLPQKSPPGRGLERLKVSVGDNPAIDLKLRTSNGGIDVKPEQPRQK